jgi:hypothetical protein
MAIEMYFEILLFQSIRRYSNSPIAFLSTYGTPIFQTQLLEIIPFQHLNDQPR